MAQGAEWVFEIPIRHVTAGDERTLQAGLIGGF